MTVVFLQLFVCVCGLILFQNAGSQFVEDFSALILNKNILYMLLILFKCSITDSQFSSVLFFTSSKKCSLINVI